MLSRNNPSKKISCVKQGLGKAKKEKITRKIEIKEELKVRAFVVFQKPVLLVSYLQKN